MLCVPRSCVSIEQWVHNNDGLVWMLCNSWTYKEINCHKSFLNLLLVMYIDWMNKYFMQLYPHLLNNFCNVSLLMLYSDVYRVALHNKNENCKLRQNKKQFWWWISLSAQTGNRVKSVTVTTSTPFRVWAHSLFLYEIVDAAMNLRHLEFRALSTTLLMYCPV